MMWGTWCKLVGHDWIKVVLAVGRKRHFYECSRCGVVEHKPPAENE